MKRSFSRVSTRFSIVVYILCLLSVVLLEMDSAGPHLTFAGRGKNFSFRSKERCVVSAVFHSCVIKMSFSWPSTGYVTWKHFIIFAGRKLVVPHYHQMTKPLYLLFHDNYIIKWKSSSRPHNHWLNSYPAVFILFRMPFNLYYSPLLIWVPVNFSSRYFYSFKVSPTVTISESCNLRLQYKFDLHSGVRLENYFKQWFAVDSRRCMLLEIRISL